MPGRCGLLAAALATSPGPVHAPARASWRMPEGGGSRWRARVGQATRRPGAASPKAAVLARGDDPPEPPETAVGRATRRPVGQATRRPGAASPKAAVLAQG